RLAPPFRGTLLFPGIEFRVLAFVFFIVRTKDLLYEFVSYHILLVQLDVRDAVDVAEYPHSSGETTSLIPRKVHLRHVSGDDCLRIRTDTSEEHLYLEISRVLRFIENDECIVKRTSTHVCKRRNLDCAGRHIIS